MSTISQHFGQSVPSTSKKLSDFYPINVRMGLELEVEHADSVILSEQSCAYWNNISDASLRNEGREFVHSSPQYGDKLVDSLKVLTSDLAQASVYLSHRCSLHCHIDFRERTPEEVEKFLMLYMLVEPALYTLSSKDRYNNIYCPGLSHTTELLKTAATMFCAGDIFSVVNRWEKYTGINLQPLGSFGSVEIRTHSGSTQFEDLCMWTKLLNCMYKACIELSKEDIYKLSSPEHIAELFTPDLQEKILCDNMYKFFGNARLNLTYYELVPKAAERAALNPAARSENVRVSLRSNQTIAEILGVN